MEEEEEYIEPIAFYFHHTSSIESSLMTPTDACCTQTIRLFLDSVRLCSYLLRIECRSA